MNFNQPYDREEFFELLKDFLPDFSQDIRDVVTESKIFKSAILLGSCDKLNLRIFEIDLKASLDRRIAITTEAFKLMKQHQEYRALVIFQTENDSDWRLSLLTSKPTIDDGKVLTRLSNPRRYSYLLGPSAKTVTPYKYLIKSGTVLDFSDLQKRFSVEVVNKEFYDSIADLYTSLVGGKRKKGSHFVEYPGLLKIHGKTAQSFEHQEFAVRLIGRLVFSWFLREKRSNEGTSLIPEAILSSNAAQQPMYYHQVLEPLFFEVLNKKSRDREAPFRGEPYSLVPYLNGGLFSPKKGEGGDYYEYSTATEGGKPGVVTVPDEWLQELTRLLDRYNFTVDENTSYDVDLSVDPEMLGRIFENLLAEINPETGESARKSTGSFYTPRPIVEYMVDRSLVYYLESKTGINVEKIEALVSYDLSDDEENPLNDTEINKIINALSELTVLDPACGSGAFPIGILQKVVFMLQRIDPIAKRWLAKQLKQVTPELRRHFEAQYDEKKYDYLRKLGIIRESIYGVDIQPIATEIARLRCFLTLIVEEAVIDNEDNRGIEPLPNLDFKFVSANSLLCLPENGQISQDNQQEIFEDSAHIEELRRIRDLYFGAASQERAELQIQFGSLQKKMAIKNIDEYKGSASKLYDTLTRWEPFEHNVTDWFDPEWMFGVKEFDIVIANPPYLGEKGHKDLFRKIRVDGLKKFYMGRMDLFYFFFHLAMNLNKQNGVTTFISTNYYPTASGAKKLRKDIHDRTVVKELINFNDLKIFESALGQHNLISILEKTSLDVETAVTMVSSKGLANVDTLSQILGQQSDEASYCKTLRSDLFDGKDFYIRFSCAAADSGSTLDDLLLKIALQGEPLGEISNINQGVLSGADTLTNKHIEKYGDLGNVGEGIFVLDSLKINDERVLNEIPDNERALLRPFFKNSNIHRYVCDREPTKYIIYVTKLTDIEQYPYIHEHLRKYKSIISQKRETLQGKIPWYSLHWPRKLRVFEDKKIVVPYRAPINTFAYVEGPWYFRTDAYSITQKKENFQLKYLLGVLNSKLAYMWLYHRGKRKGNTLELFYDPLTRIPIRIASEEEQNEIVNIVETIIRAKKDLAEADVSGCEHQIDLLVYKLYGLTTEEIEIVESTVKQGQNVSV